MKRVLRNGARALIPLKFRLRMERKELHCVHVITSFEMFITTIKITREGHNVTFFWVLVDICTYLTVMTDCSKIESLTTRLNYGYLVALPGLRRSNRQLLLLNIVT